jgi:hypothetical protein
MTRDEDDAERHDLLARLGRLNPTTVVIAAVALFLLVLLLPDPLAGGLILVIAAGLAALLTRTWRILPTQQRVLRLVVIGLLAAVAVSRLA